MSLRPAAEERAAKELTTGAGGAMTKITEPTARVFIAETVLAAEKMTPMGGLYVCGGLSGLLCLIGATNIFIVEDVS